MMQEMSISLLGDEDNFPVTYSYKAWDCSLSGETMKE